MEGSRKKSHKSAFTCPRCRANFNTAANLEKHQEMPCHWDPSRRVTPLRMPDPQKWEQLLRYKTSASAELSPLTFYADLEVSSDRPPSETVERITHRLQRRVASAAYLSVGHNGYLPSRRCWLDVMRAEDGPYAVVERFLTSLLRVWLKTRDQQLRVSYCDIGCGMVEGDAGCYGLEFVRSFAALVVGCLSAWAVCQCFVNG
ncbi:unnamed protein product, partial [Symbiodinium sp. KB8]